MSVSILVAGDYVPNGRIFGMIENKDFSFLDEIVPYTSSVDYSILNLEAPIVVDDKAQPIKKTGPNLKAPKSVVESLKYGGFKCVTLANNHFRDFGEEGVNTTFCYLSDEGVSYVGAGRNIEEARRVLFKEINGSKIAIINCCEHEWSIASDNYGGANPLDMVEIPRSIIYAKNNADYVIVITHGGTEHYPLPTPRMKKTYRFFVELGADVIINHHQHCYSGYELYKEKPIFYGLGNFCFDKLFVDTPQSWYEGYFVVLKFGSEIGFDIHRYIQFAQDNPCICIKEKDNVFSEILSSYNEAISDDDKLNDAFSKMAEKKKCSIDGLLSPYTGFFKILSSKKLLPSFVNDTRRRALLAHSQCESHRDILQFCLNKEISAE